MASTKTEKRGVGSELEVLLQPHVEERHVGQAGRTRRAAASTTLVPSGRKLKSRRRCPGGRCGRRRGSRSWRDEEARRELVDRLDLERPRDVAGSAGRRCSRSRSGPCRSPRNCKPPRCSRVTPETLSVRRPVERSQVAEALSCHLPVMRFRRLKLTAFGSLPTPGGFVMRNWRTEGSLVSRKTENVRPVAVSSPSRASVNGTSRTSRRFLARPDSHFPASGRS